MVQARIHLGQVEVQDPIPSSWEGQLIKLVPLSPDDPLPDLERRLADLHALGSMEFLPGERAAIEQDLHLLNQLSREALARLASP
jgi:hypothetical protein